MKVRFPEDIRIFIACGHTDMRKSIDGLAAIVSQTYNLDPFRNALFLFCGKRRDRIKALSIEMTHRYMVADLNLKEIALKKMHEPESSPLNARFHASEELLQFLDTL